MKNSANLSLIVLILIVLGCSCPKMNDAEKRPKNDAPAKKSDSSTKKSDDSFDSAPAGESQSKSEEIPATNSEDTMLSLEKYNRIRYGMAYLEVMEILGADGRIIKVLPDGSVRYVWGDDYTFIMITFVNDKVEFKSQNNLN